MPDHALFRANMLAGVAATALLLGGAAGAVAQVTPSGPSAVQSGPPSAQPPAAPATSLDTDGTPNEDIVVTGIRRSIANAINEKRETVNVVDVINADDVGKLPDQNLAEVLENVSGIQIDRSAGVGSSVSIRGSSQNLVLINGRVTTPAGGERGGVSFDDVPAEIISSVRVTKVPTADQVEGSVGGIVDLRTYRGLGLREPLTVVRAQMEYADKAERYNPTLAGIVGRQFDTSIGRIGFVLSGSYQTQSVREDTLNVRQNPRTDVDLNGDRVNDPYLAPNFIGQYFLTRNRVNKTINGSAEWEASDRLKFFVDGTYLNQKNRGTQPGVFLQNTVDNPATARFEQRTSSGVSYLQQIQSTLGNTQVRVTGEAPTRLTETYLAAAGGEWTSGDVTIKFEGNRAGSKTLDAGFQLVAQYSTPGPAMNSPAGRIQLPLLYDLTRPDLYVVNDPNSPLSANISNPAFYNTFIARDNFTRFRNVDNAGRIDIEWKADLGPLRSVEIGARYNETTSRRTKTTQVSRQFPEATLPLRVAARPDLYTLAPNDFFKFTGDRYFGNFVVARGLTDDPNAARAAVGLPLVPPDDPSARFTVKEQGIAGYAKANLETDIFGMRLRGEAGVRVARTKQTGTGLNTVGSALVPVSATQKYTYALPSVILSLEPARQFVVRASYGKSLRRPDFLQLAPSTVFPVINNYVTAGNPDLRPQTVDQYDAAVEWYPDRNSIVSVGGFYKKYQDLVVTVAVPPQLRDPALGFFNQGNCVGGIFNPVAVDLSGAVGICTGINQPQNQGNATLKGVEVAFQHSLTYLPGPLSGLGVIANYTYQDGKRSVPFTVPTALTPGRVVTIPFGLRELSKNNYNVTVFYEKYGISARVRYTFRDPFLRTESTDATNNLPLYQEQRSQLNASVTIDVNPKFALVFSGVNLTNKPIKERAIFIDGPLTTERIADRRYMFGVRGTL